jgi:hypothetical protein
MNGQIETYGIFLLLNSLADDLATALNKKQFRQSN